MCDDSTFSQRFELNFLKKYLQIAIWKIYILYIPEAFTHNTICFSYSPNIAFSVAGRAQSCFLWLGSLKCSFNKIKLQLHQRKKLKIIQFSTVWHWNFDTNLLSLTLPRIFFMDTKSVCLNGAQAVFKLWGRNSFRSFSSINDKGSTKKSNHQQTSHWKLQSKRSKMCYK